MTVPKARDAIKATQLMNRLEKHGFGEVDMKPSQVKALEIVLKKIRADLSSVTLANDPESGPLVVKWES